MPKQEQISISMVQWLASNNTQFSIEFSSRSCW